MVHEVKIYRDTQGEEELEILVPYPEMKKAVEKLCNIENHIPICDFCSSVDEVYSFFPELGHKCMCQKCAKGHKKMVKWYVEDLHPVFNSLISWVLNYDLNWNEKDFKVIDDFFSCKGHHNLHIETFIEENL